MALDLDALKGQCNVTTDTDDELLTRLLASASKHVERHLGFALNDADEFPEGTPEDVEQAVLMTAAHWYENREATLVGVAAQVLPIGVTAILDNHRSYSFAAADE